jgi:hypothetical protein
VTRDNGESLLHRLQRWIGSVNPAEIFGAFFLTWKRSTSALVSARVCRRLECESFGIASPPILRWLSNMLPQRASLLALLLFCLSRIASAEVVEILRDPWGIPHVFAETDAAAFYGLGYARPKIEHSR